MILIDLVLALNGHGLKIVETPGWHSRGHGPFVKVETIVCHHTAGPVTGNMPSLGVVTNGRAGLAGPLCNLGLGRDGTVYVVAAGIAWHAGVVRSQSYANTHSIGIEAEATGTGSWSELQLNAYATLCAALCDHYRIPVSRVLGHKEVCAPLGRKIDPNFNMPSFRSRVTNALHANPETLKDQDMTPEQLASAPISMLRGAKDIATKVTLQEVLRDLEGTQDRHGAQLTRIEKALELLTKKG